MRLLVVTVVATLGLAGPAVAASPSTPHGPAAASTVFIRGGGYGHGVGMSQYGAYGYALHGATYRQILAHYYSGTALRTTNPNRVVRVLLGSGRLAFAGAARAVGAGGARGAGTAQKRLHPSVTYDVRVRGGMLALIDHSTHKRVGRFVPPLTITGPGPLNLVGIGTYRGALDLRPIGAGRVQIVNALGLDDYVRGVVGSEMPPSWAPEALKAQAVAARTYAITSPVAGRGYNLYDDTRSQVYKGVAAETSATDAAVAATTGQIVTYKGAPAITYFFASSGGHTENVEDAFPGTPPDPWLRGVPDPYDGAGGDPYHQWVRKLSGAAARARLGMLAEGRLIGIRVVQHGASPRIVSAEVVGTRGTRTVTGAQLERSLGLLSTWASFTTISIAAGGTSRPAGGPGSGGASPGRAGDLPFAAQVGHVLAMVANAFPAVRGSVFPTAPGALATIESRAGGGWQARSTVALGSGGHFATRVPGPGVYRLVYRGLDGPSVAVR